MNSKITQIVRLLLGLVFVVFGLNGFFHYLPMPPPPDAAVPFMTGLFKAGYFFPVLMGAQTVIGLMLLTGTWVPLALVALAPISLEIVLYHVFLAPAGGIIAAPVVLMHIFLGWAYFDHFRPLFINIRNQ